MNIERTLLKWLLWPVHRAWLRVSGARIGTQEPSEGRMGILVLTTTGWRSGERRSVPVYFIRDRERLVMVASNAGADRDPAWYGNLKANPSARVQVGTAVTNVVARDATSEERERLWPELVRRNPSYTRYERRAARTLPVVVLEPAAS